LLANETSGPSLSIATPEEGYAIMVLLVDDQLIVGEVIRRMVSTQSNMDFHFCSSAQDALALAKEVKPTVILQDLVMPGTDGLDLVREYRAHPETCGIPIIVLSSKEEPLTKREAFRAGASDYVVKLPDEIELIARIQYHSRAYLNQLQRDEAYRALRESQRQLLEMNFELQRLTNLDGLTGLSNRRYFDRYIDVEWTRATQTHSLLSLLMVDVDSFKHFNDTSGHLAGDSILKKVAAVIQRLFRPSLDCAARFGGDEFAIVLPGLTPTDHKALAEQLRQEVEALKLEHQHQDGAIHFLTISVGGASIIPNPGDSPYTLIDAADRALYEAKETGRNRVVAKERIADEWVGL
jgi:two-component system chemotaxis family response regulator WspR